MTYSHNYDSLKSDIPDNDLIILEIIKVATPAPKNNLFLLEIPCLMIWHNVITENYCILALPGKRKSYVQHSKGQAYL